MRFILILICLVEAASICPVRADDCASSASQTDMNLCEDAALKRADAELNKTYQEILERLKDSQETKQLLVASQRLWVRPWLLSRRWRAIPGFMSILGWRL